MEAQKPREGIPEDPTHGGLGNEAGEAVGIAEESEFGHPRIMTRFVRPGKT
jgi:hypothetical protein